MISLLRLAALSATVLPLACQAATVSLMGSTVTAQYFSGATERFSGTAVVDGDVEFDDISALAGGQWLWDVDIGANTFDFRVTSTFSGASVYGSAQSWRITIDPSLHFIMSAEVLDTLPLGMTVSYAGNVATFLMPAGRWPASLGNVHAATFVLAADDDAGAVPEPASWALGATALLAALAAGRRRTRTQGAARLPNRG